MEQELLTREEMPIQVTEFIEQVMRKIHAEHSQEVKMVLFAAVSIIFGYGAYKEYELVTKTAAGQEV